MSSGDKIKDLLNAGDALKDAAKAVAETTDPGRDFSARAAQDDLVDAERHWNRAASLVDPSDYPC